MESDRMGYRAGLTDAKFANQRDVDDERGEHEPRTASRRRCRPRSARSSYHWTTIGESRI